MPNQSYNMRAGQDGPEIEGNAGEVLTLQGDGRIAAEPLPPPTVTKVFNREGDIVAEFGDYTAALVENDSNVAGPSLEDALQTLLNRPDIFGSGSDGDLTAAAGTTTLTRDTFYDTVVLTGTARISTGGYKLFILHWDATNAPAGAIDYSGNAGGDAVIGSSAGNTGGPALPGNTVGGATAGAVGGDPVSSGDGQNGGPGPAILLGCGGVGGAGGVGGIGGSGAGGLGGAPGAIANRPKLYDARQELAMLTAATTFSQVTGGSAGGGGGSGGGGIGNEGGPSGGSGSAGGVVFLRVQTLTVSPATAAGACRAKGGRGGNGARSDLAGNVGGGSGGGAGGGGFIHAVVGQVIGDTVPDFFDASGGNGGALAAGFGTGTAGNNGVGGEGGEVVLINIAAGTVAVSTRGAAAGQTGGIATLSA